MATHLAETDINPFGNAPTQPVDAVPVIRSEHREDLLTRMIEHQAARVPSHAFLFAAFCAMTASLTAEFADRPRASRFLGMWVGPLLTMGVYTKLVKTFGAR